MSDYTFYQVEKKPPIAWVYLNRPEKKNVMNPPAWKEIIPLFADLDADPDIRAVVISGRGDCFSGGIDLMAMAQELRREGIEIPILMLTSLAKITGMEYGRDSDVLPVDEFIEKPVAPADFIAKVKALLEK